MKKLFITAIKKNEPVAVKLLSQGSGTYDCQNEKGEPVELFRFPELDRVVDKLTDDDDLEDVQPIIEINYDGKVYEIYVLESWADASKKA